MSDHSALWWREYDYAAEYCARRGIRGEIGDPLPDLLSDRVCREIDADPESFQERVRACAYQFAMERHDA